MVQINFAAREINCKVVYYGPGRSGKTTNLEYVHSHSPKKAVGEMVSIATETDRTLFFDFLPLDIGKVAGMQVRFQLYTVPGQVYYNATRKLVLQGVDGVIFVADAQRSMFEENIESFKNLEDNLRENGYDPDSVPIAMQWNKTDLSDLSPMEELEAKLNKKGFPSNKAVATEGKGVFETLKKVAVVVLEKLHQEYGSGDKDAQQLEKEAQKMRPDAAAASAQPQQPPSLRPKPEAPEPGSSEEPSVRRPAQEPAASRRPTEAQRPAREPEPASPPAPEQKRMPVNSPGSRPPAPKPAAPPSPKFTEPKVKKKPPPVKRQKVISLGKKKRNSGAWLWVVLILLSFGLIGAVAFFVINAL